MTRAQQQAMFAQINAYRTNPRKAAIRRKISAGVIGGTAAYLSARPIYGALQRLAIGHPRRSLVLGAAGLVGGTVGLGAHALLARDWRMTHTPEGRYSPIMRKRLRRAVRAIPVRG